MKNQARGAQGFDSVRGLYAGLPRQQIGEIAGLGLGRPDVTALWFGETDMPTPAFISDEATRSLARGETFYTRQRGIPELRSALRAYLERVHSADLDEERITVTSGAMHAIDLAIRLVAGPGDEVVVVDPVWPNIHGALHLSGASVRRVVIRPEDDGSWRLNLSQIEKTLNSCTKAVFVASPGNPTGWALSRGELEGLLELCRRRGIWLIVDEVYSRLVFGQEAAPSILDLSEANDRVLVVNSFSKNWAMTGWRLGWIVAPTNVGRILGDMTYYNTSGVPVFIQRAGIAALEGGETFLRELKARVDWNLGLVFGMLERLGLHDCNQRPAGGLYSFFAVPWLNDSYSFCQQLFADTGIGVAPGSAFGPEFTSFLRVCCAVDPLRLRPALGALEAKLLDARIVSGRLFEGQHDHRRT